MKTIVFIRHGKSDWDQAELTDFERPLNKRGLRDAPFMGNLLKSKGINPNIIISSPAVRAKTTAMLISEALDYPIQNIRYEKAIYEYGPNSVISIINSLEQSINTAIIVGHNPDLTHLVNFLCGEHFDNVPTCGTVCIDFEIQHWNEIPGATGKIRFFEYPKLYLKEK